MSTDYRSQVKCSNHEALNAIAIAIIADCKEAALHWNDDPTQFSVKSSNYTPHQEIKAISSCFPDDVITCNYRDEMHDYSEAYIVEYHNGEYKELDKGAQDPDSNRKDWIFDRRSIDNYREAQMSGMTAQQKALEIMRG